LDKASGPLAGARSSAVAAPLPLAYVVGWFGIHALLGLAWKEIPQLALVHGVLTTVVTLLVGVRGGPTAVAAAALYVGASQILWRMSKAALPHMIGMYLVVLLCVFAALRRRTHPRPLALLYFLPLLPSVFLTFATVSDLERARQLVAFNLAGPAALFAAVWFASTVQRPIALWRVAAVAGGPVAATSAAILAGTMRLEEIRFTTESNFAMSGGYGPNQVASVLSFGLLLLAAYVWLRGRRRVKPLVWGVIVALAVQTLLTFSRAGIAMVLGALGGMGILLLKRKEMRIAVLASAVAAWATSNYFLVPVLDDFTQGAFLQRFTDPNLSNRDAIAKSDLEIFRANPVAGVGPGIAAEIRGIVSRSAIAAHTEFTRILAEHGLLGAISLLALIALSVRSVRAADNTPRRAWVLGMFTWAWLYFAVNAFRTVLPATAIMLALLVLAGQQGRPPLETETLNRRSSGKRLQPRNASRATVPLMT
jgi:hypothetical protein